MRVLQINCDCGCYSTGKIASDLAVSLNKKGHQCVVAYGRDFKDTGIRNYRIGTKFDVYFHAMLSRLTDSCGLHSKRATKRLIGFIKKYSPDIVHLHNIHGYYINYVELFGFLKSSGIPVVWTLHDCWAFTGHCSHFENVNCKLWQTGCHDCPNISTYPKSFLDRSRRNYLAKENAFKGVWKMVIVTPSNWLKGLVSKSFLGEYPVQVIHNGIDASSFKKKQDSIYARFNIANKKVILGVASTWSANKGYDDFLKLSSLIDDKYVIFLIGLNDKQLKNLPSNVIGIKKTLNMDELISYYSGAYVLFNPTYEDTYPTVNLEAQSCGTPVITYKTGGSPESVPEKQVIPQGDLRAFVDMIENEELMVAEKSFDRGGMLEEYVNLYLKLIG